MDNHNEFKKYAMSDFNVSSSNMEYYQKQIEGSMTPYILEEREMRVTQMDIFSRLMRDRILWVAGSVNDNMSTIVQAQLMFLDNISKDDITCTSIVQVDLSSQVFQWWMLWSISNVISEP